MSWMEKQATSEIQTAIQSQTIQTALEANTSKISDAGFQSYLTSAPIPRFFISAVIGTYNSATNTIITWNQSTYIDPYRMIVPSTGIVTIPIDGFYSFVFGLECVAGAGGAINISYFNTAGGTLIIETINNTVGDTTKYKGIVPYLAPLRQGDTVRLNLGNSTVGAVSSVDSSCWGCSWVAPYLNYVGGN